MAQKTGLRHGHPTRWKFRHWSTPTEGKFGERRLKWFNGVGQDGGHDLGARGPLESDLVVPRLFEEQQWQLNNLTNEGEAEILDVYFNDQAVRASTFVRAYNDTIVEGDTLTSVLNEQTGTGYSALTYTRGTDWTPSGSSVNGATKTWTAGGGDWIDMVDVGLATIGSGTGGILVAYVALSQTRSLANGETLDITPTISAT